MGDPRCPQWDWQNGVVLSGSALSGARAGGVVGVLFVLTSFLATKALQGCRALRQRWRESAVAEAAAAEAATHALQLDNSLRDGLLHSPWGTRLQSGSPVDVPSEPLLIPGVHGSTHTAAGQLDAPVLVPYNWQNQQKGPM